MWSTADGISALRESSDSYCDPSIQSIHEWPLYKALLHQSVLGALRSHDDAAEDYFTDERRLSELIDVCYCVYEIDPTGVLLQNVETESQRNDWFHDEKPLTERLTQAAYRMMQARSNAVLGIIAGSPLLMQQILSPFRYTSSQKCRFFLPLSPLTLDSPLTDPFQPVVVSTDLANCASALLLMLFIFQPSTVMDYLIQIEDSQPFFVLLIKSLVSWPVTGFLKSLLQEIASRQTDDRCRLETALVDAGFVDCLLSVALFGQTSPLDRVYSDDSRADSPLRLAALQVAETLLREDLPILKAQLCANLADSIDVIALSLPDALKNEQQVLANVTRGTSDALITDVYPEGLTAFEQVIYLVVHATLVYASLCAKAAVCPPDTYKYTELLERAQSFWASFCLAIPRLSLSLACVPATDFSPMSSIEVGHQCEFCCPKCADTALPCTSDTPLARDSDDDYTTLTSPISPRPGPIMCALVDLLTSLAGLPALVSTSVENEIKRMQREGGCSSFCSTLFDDPFTDEPPPAPTVKPLISSPDEYRGPCTKEEIAELLLDPGLGLVTSLCRYSLTAPYASRLHVTVALMIRSCLTHAAEESEILVYDERNSIMIDADDENIGQECRMTPPHPVLVLRRASMSSPTGVAEGSTWLTIMEDQLRDSGMLNAVQAVADGIREATIDKEARLHLTALQSFVLTVGQMIPESFLPDASRSLENYKQELQPIISEWEAMLRTRQLQTLDGVLTAGPTPGFLLNDTTPGAKYDDCDQWASDPPPPRRQRSTNEIQSPFL